MNVLFFPSSYAPNIGGVEEMAGGLAASLLHSGHSVTVVTGRWPRSLAAGSRIGGAEVHRLLFRTPGRNMRSLAGFALSFLPDCLRVVRIAKKAKCDLIHVHCLGPNALYAAICARVLNVPLILTTHGELQGDDTGLNSSLFMGAVHWFAFRSAKWVSACSHYTLKNIRHTYPCASSVIYNGVVLSPRSRCAPSNTPAYVLVVARLTHNKGVDIAVRAFGKIRDSVAPLQLWVAGDGPEEQNLRRLSNDLGLTESVRFLGRRSPHEIAALSMGSLFHICPSRNEGFGLANLEGMRHSKPIVAFDVGGVSEVVSDGFCGLLVKAGEIDHFSQSILRLIKDEGLRETLSRGAYARASHFSDVQMIDGYLNVYEHILKPAPVHVPA